MSRQQYELIVGKASAEPLTTAFSGRRSMGTQPGGGGSPVKPGEWQNTWQSLLSTTPAAKQRAAYFHIPFCQHRCLYCGFFQNYTNEELETAYIDSLIQELEMSRESSYIKNGAVNAVFIGGGTPSSLAPHNIARLLTAIRTCLPLANDYEMTLEGRIHDLLPGKVEAWLGNGVNRISVGVQSFHTKVRRAAGRLDDTQTVLDKLELLASYNRATVIVDLIYGLPYQSSEVWANDLKELKTAAIDGMDLYQLAVFENSELQRAILGGKLPPAATLAEQAAMFAAAEDELSGQMLARLSICHWGKNNRERNLYNTLTKAGHSVIPFGAGAGGNIGGAAMFLQRNIEKYIKSIAAGEKPLAGMIRQSPEIDLHNEISAQLEKGYISLVALAGRYGDEVLELNPLLELWREGGLLEGSSLTVAGRFWYRNMQQSLVECWQLLNPAQAAVKMHAMAMPH